MPFRPHLDYIIPVYVRPIGLGMTNGSLRSNLTLIQFILRVHMANTGYIRQNDLFYGIYMANPGYVRQKGPILGKIATYRPYLDYIGPI